MAEKFCRIEAYNPASGGKNCTVLPEIILARNDVILIAAGTLACVRTLYLRAAALGKLNRFIACVMSEYDYASGKAADKLAQAIQRAADTKGTGAVVVYLSCAEILTQPDFESILNACTLPEDVEVRFFKRGPLTARTRRAAAELEKLMGSLPPERGQIESTAQPMPVPAPDFAGALSVLQQRDTYPLLITPGGCTCCMSLGDDINRNMKFDHTRFDDLEIACGITDASAASAALKMQTSPAGELSVVGSAIPYITGVDYYEIARQRSDTPYPAKVYPCNGMRAAQTGISDALCVIEEAMNPVKRDENLVNIIGYSQMAFPSPGVLDVGRRALEEKGFRCKIFGQEITRKEGQTLPCVNWVVSAQGLACAKQMEEHWQIPYFFALPLEECGKALFLERFEDTLGTGMTAGKRVCIAGACTIPEGASGVGMTARERVYSAGARTILEDASGAGISAGRHACSISAHAFFEGTSGAEISAENIYSGGYCETALIISQPLTAMGLAAAIKGRKPEMRTVCAFYAPLPDLRDMFEPFASENCVVFSDIDELKTKACDASIILADPLFFENIKAVFSESRFISCPDTFVSGRLKVEESRLFSEESLRTFLDEVIGKTDGWS